MYAMYAVCILLKYLSMNTVHPSMLPSHINCIQYPHSHPSLSALLPSSLTRLSLFVYPLIVYRIFAQIEEFGVSIQQDGRVMYGLEVDSILDRYEGEARLIIHIQYPRFTSTW